MVLEITNGNKGQPNESAPLTNGSNNDRKKNHGFLEDVYEKEFTDIKEIHKRWCKGLKLLQRRLQSVGRPIVMTLLAQLARLEYQDSDDLESFVIRGQELFTRLQEAVSFCRYSNDNFFRSL